MAQVRPSFLSLPTELIEEIIIISAHLGDPRIVATLSQTCHPFHSLVYHQSHKHIWREMFLVIFDDPRPALNLRVQGRAPLRQLDPNDNKGKGKSGSGNCLDFPWEDEYKQRIWTETFVLRRARPPRSPDLPSTDAELGVALETLLRVISTAAPLPYETIACHMASRCHPCGQQPHPVFSPLLVAAHAQPSLVLRSRNTAWLMRVLAHGLPCALMARLTVFDENGKVNVQKTRVKWDGVLARLVAQIGLMTPVRSTPCTSERLPHTVVVPCTAASGSADAAAAVAGESSSSTASRVLLENEDGSDGPETRDSGNRNQDAHDLCGTSDDDDDSDFEPELEGESTDDSDEGSGIDGDDVLGTRATPATILQDGVRRMARIRVYNMAYLNPIHAFGPFLRLDTHQRSSSTTDQKLGFGAAGVQEDADALGSSSNASPPVPPIPDTNFYLSALAHAGGSDIDDAAFVPIAKEDDGDSDDNDERDGDMNVSSSEAHEGGNGSTSKSFKGRPRHAQEMSGELLRPDWAWIAAARQVIELNLRDLLVGRHQGVLSALLSLEGLRACSAPGFLASAPPEVIAKDDSEPVFEDGEGWDWAGVEGQWRCVARSLSLLARVDLFRAEDINRRCICWLDYNDLLRASRG